MMAIDRGLLVHHTGGRIVAVQENCTGSVGCTVKQRVEVLGVIVGLNHRIIDSSIRNVNPADNLGVRLRKGIKINDGDAAAILIAHILFLDLCIRVACLFVANLRIDVDSRCGNNQSDSDNDEQDRENRPTFFARLLDMSRRVLMGRWRSTLRRFRRAIRRRTVCGRRILALAALPCRHHGAWGTGMLGRGCPTLLRRTAVSGL